MNRDKIITGLAASQADGLACVTCGADYLRVQIGVCLSLCANVAAAPELSVFAVAVAACPPLALLLAVELLNRALKRHRAETANDTITENGETPENGYETGRVVRLAVVPEQSRPTADPTAEQRMWAYYVTEHSKGRMPTGAELDRIAGTNNYGRRVDAVVAATGQGIR